jgi:hypothetical protein
LATIHAVDGSDRNRATVVAVALKREGHPFEPGPFGTPLSSTVSE